MNANHLPTSVCLPPAIFEKGKFSDDCVKHGWDSPECARAAAKAALVCVDAIQKCKLQPPFPQVWVDNGWV